MNIHCIQNFFHRSRFLRLPSKNRVGLKLFTVLNILFTFRIFNNLRLPWKQSFPWNFSLYWNIIYHSGFLSNFALALKNRVALEFFTVFHMCLYHSGFLSDSRLPWKTEFALKLFTVLNILFTFRSFEQLTLALKKRGCPEFTVLNMYCLLFRIFGQLALALKKQSCPGIFHCIEYAVFIIQDFWATCGFREKQSCPGFFYCIEIFFIIQDFEQLCACPEKQSSPWIFHCIEIFFIIQNFWATSACTEIFHCIEIFSIIQYFEQLVLALKKRLALKFFTELNIPFTFRILSDLRLPWKTEGSLNSLYWICIVYCSGFLGN